MLRALAIALLAANVAFFCWASGWLDGIIGTRAHGDREPERLLRQVRPETVVVMAPAAPRAAAPPVCLESGAVDDADAGPAVAALTALLPSGTWTDARTENAAPGSAGARAAPAVTHVYRVESADADTADHLGALKLGAAGNVGFSACAASQPAR